MSVLLFFLQLLMIQIGVIHTTHISSYRATGVGPTFHHPPQLKWGITPPPQLAYNMNTRNLVKLTMSSQKMNGRSVVSKHVVEDVNKVVVSSVVENIKAALVCALHTCTQMWLSCEWRVHIM